MSVLYKYNKWLNGQYYLKYVQYCVLDGRDEYDIEQYSIKYNVLDGYFNTVVGIEQHVQNYTIKWVVVLYSIYVVHHNDYESAYRYSIIKCVVYIILPRYRY